MDIHHESGLVRAVAKRTAFTKHWFTFCNPGDDSPDFFRGLEHAADQASAEVLSQMVLGGNGMQGAVWSKEHNLAWPLTWLRGDHCIRTDPVGSQAVAVAGIPVRSLRIENRIVGRVYEDEDAVYCHLGGILPVDLNASREEQTRSFFENMETALASAGMTFLDVVRTWLYLDQLLEWYDEFNEVRTQFFTERGIFDHRVPASTGIGASNPAGAALIGDAIAIKPKNSRVRIEAVDSPLQCPAPDYKSSFSRAAEVTFPDGRELYVSGTASIDLQGRTAHVGDAEKQISLTMEVVEAILQSRGMSWSDVTQGIAYVKDPAYLDLYRAYEQSTGLENLPVACLHSDVCRDDLLFEIEVDAFSTNSAPPS